MPVPSTLKHYPLGHPIVDGPHSVCVSLPTMADVIGYEEKDPRVRSVMQGGYPRFYENHLVRDCRHGIAGQNGIDADGFFLFPDRASAENAKAHVGAADGLIEIAADPFHGLAVPAETESLREKLANFQQHTGHLLSSREAEDWLCSHGVLDQPWPEELSELSAEESDRSIRSHLHDVYRCRSIDDVYLFRGGMSAFYAGFQCLRDEQLKRGRQIWVQLGWLYVDTIRILEKWAPSGGEPIVQHQVMDLDSLEELFAHSGASIAGVVTEIPTNPLIQTTDVPRLRELCDRVGAALVLDPTMASPHNVNILPLSDLHVNSLTKYAGHKGDVLLGALGLNVDSPFYPCLKENLPHYRVPPYGRDLRRLAKVIHHYPEVVERMNRSTPIIVDWLERHPKVAHVWWSREAASKANFDRIAHHANGPGCMISFSLTIDLAPFYDRVRMAKSPSFGTHFSMMCPFLYLAHYDLVSSTEGRRMLEEKSIPPELVRLSVGLEPVEEIIACLEEALQ